MTNQRAATGRGALGGIVRGADGRALAGVCVLASPAKRARPVTGGRVTVTSGTGAFLITDLPTGPYLLRYRNCLARTGAVRSADARGPGALTVPAAASRGYVTGGQVTMVGQVTVRPRAAGLAAAMPRPAAPKRSSLNEFTAAGPRRAGGRKPGGIAGLVLGPHGRHLNGLCFNVYFNGGYFGSSIGANGRYSTGKVVPPGTYTVGFTAACGLPYGVPSANWAPQWFRAKFRASAASAVVVRAGKITSGISGTMRPGGIISGTVTGHNGRGLAGVCVVAAAPDGTVVQQVTTPRSGRYRFAGLDPGRYGIGFFPGCVAGSAYLPSWWPGTAKETSKGMIRTGFGSARTHVDQQMVLGGTISGVVRFKNSRGAPIRGICVDATPAGRTAGADYLVATNASGRYAITGLPAGRYFLNFAPGCDNKGNYLGQNYPHPVTVRLSRETGGINAYLQPGAIIEGKVTSRSDGAGLKGICVTTADGYATTVTGAGGTYAMNQLTPGTVALQFFNCSAKGNFAPQSYPHSIKVGPGQVISGIDAALLPGATISGAITLTTGGKPTGVCVFAAPVGVNADFAGAASTQRGGYAIEDLPPGLYQVQYSACGGPNIADAWFAGPGRATANGADADQVYVPAGGLVAGINAALEPGGSISGWIYGPPDQQGSFVCLTMTEIASGVIASEFFPGSVGDGYTIWGFAPGKYAVEFTPCSGQDLAAQWYDRASGPGKATPVLVRPGHTTWNIDAQMTAGGSVTGKVVSKAAGKPLAGVCVVAAGPSQPAAGYGRTNRTGDYVVTGLGTGTFRLYLFACGGTHLVPAVTGKLRAVAGKAVAAPQVAMATYRAGAIFGRITAAGSPRAPVAGACAEALPLAGGLAGELETQSGFAGRDGYYQITGLVPGKYRVFVTACNSDLNLVPQWYQGTARKAKAAVVAVAAGKTTRSVNATLQRYGAIAGTVTGQADAALAGICVQATPAGRPAAPYLAESAAGNGGYSTGPLPPGKYLVEFESGCAVAGYAAAWWQGAHNMKDATWVLVRAGRTRSGIDARMTPAG
jgi:hypothetical protein